MRHTIDAIKLDTVTGPIDLTLRGLGSFSHELGSQLVGPQSGGPYQEIVMQARRGEVVTFGTNAIESLLDNVNLLTATCIDSDVDDFGIDMFGQALSECGVDGRVSGANHLRTRAGDARLFVTGISAAAGEPAVASVVVVLLSADGEAAPSATVYNVALPADPIANEFFMLGRLRIAGVSIDPANVLAWSYEAGQNYEVVYGEGPFPEEVVLTSMQPVVTIETDDTSLVAAAKIPEGGKACTHANTEMFLRKLDATTRELYGLGESQHVRFTAAGLAEVSTLRSGTGSSRATNQVRVTCEGDNGAAPLQVATSQAITT